MTEYSIDEQKKILRSMKRLKHSILADREIKAELVAMEELGTLGIQPRLEGTLADLLKGETEEQ